MPDIVVLGVGNTIRGDDGIGIFAVRELKKTLAHSYRRNVDIKEMEDSSINMMERVQGYRKLILVDAISVNGAQPGRLHRLTQEDLRGKKEPYSTHQIGLPKLLALAKELNVDLPNDIVVFAVEVSEAETFSTALTPQLKEKLGKIVARIEKEIKHGY